MGVRGVYEKVSIYNLKFVICNLGERREEGRVLKVGLSISLFERLFQRDFKRMMLTGLLGV
jgi:hypothetical protein